MKLHFAATTLVLAASTCLPAAIYAAPTASVHAPVHALFGKPHQVRVTLRNDGKQAITVKAGEQELSIDPGKTAPVKLMPGEKIVAVTASPDHTAGDLLATVSDTMDQGTIGLK